jgi:hypothetical protein
LKRLKETEMKNAYFSAVISAALLAGSLQIQCQAQAPAKVASNTASNNQIKRPKSPEQIQMETYFQNLKTPISLPDIPDIGSHGKYRFGLERTDKTGKTLIGMRYGTSTPPTQVIDFYKQSLIASKWT